MRRSARVITNERTETSSSSLRIASAQARISSPVFAWPNWHQVGEELGEAALVAAAVGPDLVAAISCKLAYASFDVVADLAYFLEWLAGWVVDLPVFAAADYVGAAALAVERDCLVGVQLHLKIDLLWCAVGDVDADFAHCFDDVWPDRGRGLLAG
jgi:hypothetical protein